LELQKESEKIRRESITSKKETTLHDINEALEIIEHEKERNLLEISSAREVDNAKRILALEKENHITTLTEKDLERDKLTREQGLAFQKKDQDMQIELLQEKVKSFVERAKAIQPELVMALQTLGDKLLAGELAENMSAQAILGGKSLVDVVNGLLRGTALGNRLKFDDPEFMQQIGALFERSNQED